jgi:ribosomal-protein-alanine N-acetyltransferase
LRKDLGGILTIESASFGPEAYDCKLFAYYLTKCGDLFLVAERSVSVCAYMITCVRGKAPGRAELISVAVDPASRESGVASALLEATLRRLRRRRVANLQLVVRDSNQSALAFYEKYGFRPIRRVPAYYEDGGDGIAMTRRVIPE